MGARNDVNVMAWLIVSRFFCVTSDFAHKILRMHTPRDVCASHEALAKGLKLVDRQQSSIILCSVEQASVVGKSQSANLCF